MILLDHGTQFGETPECLRENCTFGRPRRIRGTTEGMRHTAVGEWLRVTYSRFIQSLVPRFDDFGPLAGLLSVHGDYIRAVDAREQVVAVADAFGKLVIVVMVVSVALVVASSV